MKLKRLIGVMLLLSSFVVMVACEGQTVEEVDDNSVRFAGLDGSVRIVTDNETGCKYIREESGSGYSRSVALSVLLKSDGTPDCGQNN